MKNRWACFHHFAIYIFGLIIISTSANAGSFRDFILDEGLNDSPLSAQVPANSKSAACMQCHNGSKAKSVGLKHADSAMTFTSHGSSNHPVGMSYTSYARKSPASYIAPARLDSRIKLENGQVTCVSCHETKSHETVVAVQSEQNIAREKCSSTKSLTTGSNQTRLCMSCHAM